MCLMVPAQGTFGTTVEQFRNFRPGAPPLPMVARRNVTHRKEHMLPLGKYSFGMGDRFAHQARAQLRACIKAAEQGVEVIPVWNKSNREHIIIGSEPSSIRGAADVRDLKWSKPSPPSRTANLSGF